jgi:predicted nucleic acid-binding protein
MKSFDLNYVALALTREATLITEDRAILSLDPYKCGRKSPRIRTPKDYLKNLKK